MKLECGECGRRRDVRFFKSERGRVCQDCQRGRAAERAHARHVEETYDITQAEYEFILEVQDGKCAICKGTRDYHLHVDHDHARHRAGVPMRECVRGLLCKQCNKRLLPAAKDDPNILREAIAYLQLPPAYKALSFFGVGCTTRTDDAACADDEAREGDHGRRVARDLPTGDRGQGGRLAA